MEYREVTSHQVGGFTTPEWKDLIDTFEILGKRYRVVKWARGVAPWGQPIVAELHESESGEKTILISLPNQGGRNLAILNGHMWEIWISPKEEIHVVRPAKGKRGIPPDEYLWLTGE